MPFLDTTFYSLFFLLVYRRSVIEYTSRMSSIAPHSLDTHVIQNSSFCITSDLLVQQKTRARIVFLFSDCHKFSILFLKQRRLSTRTITRGLVIVTAISETWFTTYQVFSEEEQQKKIHIWNMTSQWTREY